MYSFNSDAADTVWLFNHGAAIVWEWLLTAALSLVRIVNEFSLSPCFLVNLDK